MGLSLALALLLVSGTALGQSTRKFYRDDPVTVEPETQDASKVANFKIDLFYDLMLNQFTRPGEPAGPRAKNVNTIDEVPDSSWFTNRIPERPVSIDEAVRGATTGNGPAPGKWTVDPRQDRRRRARIHDPRRCRRDVVPGVRSQEQPGRRNRRGGRRQPHFLDTGLLSGRVLHQRAPPRPVDG